MDSDMQKPNIDVALRVPYLFHRNGSRIPKGTNRIIFSMVFLKSAIIGRNGMSVKDNSKRINCKVGMPTNK
jgi:hypothetical protein